MELAVKNRAGEPAGTVDASDYVWAAPMHETVLHQVVVAQQANRRQGTHDTKRRSEVIASGRKLRSQKHTGSARLGDAASPHLRGGGVAHGPHPRSHRKRVPARVRRMALRVALSEQVRRGRVVVLDELKLDEPRTKPVVELLENLGVAEGALLVTAATDRVAVKSANNLKRVQVLAAPLLNPLQAIAARNIVITKDAVGIVDETWGGEQRRPARGTAAARPGAIGRMNEPGTGNRLSGRAL